MSGTGVPDGTTVLSIQSSTALTLSANATASGAKTLTFGVEPVSLDEAKAWCQIQFTDADATVRMLIQAARKYAETRLKQALITQTWRLYLDSFAAAGGYYDPSIRRIWIDNNGISGLGFYPNFLPNSSGIINLPMSPLQSVTAVKYYDTSGTLQTVSSSVYTISKGVPGRVQTHSNQVWPIARAEADSVYVDYVAGYGPTSANISDNVRLAINYLVYSWYANPQPILAGRFTIIPDVVNNLLAPNDPGVYA